jgi:uncharacterized membrane protein
MSQFSNAKLLGGIGALLTILTIIPAAGFILGIVGIILIFIAIKQISDEIKDTTIYNNYLWFFVLCIIALVVAAAITIIGLAGSSFFTIIQTVNWQNPTEVLDIIAPALIACVLGLIVGWILMIVATMYLRKSYDRIAEQTKVDLFKTTGLLYLIGAVTMIILIGFLILFIAKILEIISFFTLPDTPPVKETTPSPVIQPPPPNTSP